MIVAWADVTRYPVDLLQALIYILYLCLNIQVDTYIYIHILLFYNLLYVQLHYDDIF